MTNVKWFTDKGKKSFTKWPSEKPVLRDFWQDNKWIHLPRSQLQIARNEKSNKEFDFS